MTRLNRITFNGFKSFAGKISVPFPSNFSVICGPNGSGKSNIVDGIIFVLGTISARSIRAKKLENLIFNGSEKNKPAEHCEVSLYLDNSDKKLPGYEDEIKITRKVSRSGVSSYKISGKSATRAKIIDLMANFNLSPDGYNIIVQGDVMRITEMSPNERREMIDDISGIAEFDDKRIKTMKELEKVETRVREAMIIAAEKQKLVSRLKKEKENAETYHKINADLIKSKASLVKRKTDDSLAVVSKIDEELKGFLKNFDSIGGDFEKLEKQIEKIEKSMKMKRDDIIKKSRNYDIMRKIENIQGEILRKRDRIAINDRESERIESVLSMMRGGSNTAVKELMRQKKSGIYGTVSSLVKIPQQYSAALEVAIGRHSSDIVVDNDRTAAECIKHLRDSRTGRARFIPMNKIKGKTKKRNPEIEKNIIGFAIDLIDFDAKYLSAMEYVLGSTLVAKNIDIARKIPDYRISTLDGDLIEISGAMIGGFYRKGKAPKQTIDVEKYKNENDQFFIEIGELEKELEELKGKEQTESDVVLKLQDDVSRDEELLEDLRNQRKTQYEERMEAQNKISKLKIEKARLEATLDNLKLEAKEYREVKEYYDLSIDELQEKIRRCLIDINKLGPVNLKAIDEFGTINVEFEELKKKLDKLLEEKDAIVKTVDEIEKKRRDKFTETMEEVKNNFITIYRDLANGKADLRLEEENNIESGLVIEANPMGKKVLNIDSMSGGEKTLTSLAFLFAVMKHYSSPFYILDEVDAALDKTNTQKVADLIKKYSETIQFIVITHNDLTVSKADKVFGVSIESGVSKVFGIDMPKG